MRCDMFMGQTGFKKGCMLLSYKCSIPNLLWFNRNQPKNGYYYIVVQYYSNNSTVTLC